MDINTLVKHAQIRARDNMNHTPAVGQQSLEVYCHSVALALHEALEMRKNRRPAQWRGSESPKRLQGVGDVSGEEGDDYIPGADDTCGWGSHIADAVIILARMCRAYRIDLDALLERKLRREFK